MKKLAVLIAMCVAMPAVAGDIAAGKAKSATCAACHGANGISQIPMYPNLAGQKEQYLVLQMKAFRDGERKNMVMAPMAKPLSDDDIANLSAYYASLDPAGK
ncbi:cytochrome c [Bowmanella sp. Y26]|uniref:c-type cytochrome n=1 Tax=Bowmanella yangjiangensis TaxID=2811230 RepID=UPI001BDC3CB0|nr:cytochrome c [Bowmanella yangjiangensis]MBT1064110.1 cytochrome c [Bowmanella yangjiangensis]